MPVFDDREHEEAVVVVDLVSCKEIVHVREGIVGMWR